MTAGGADDEPTLPADGTELVLESIAGGRYELEGFVGAGGSKDVYRARDTILDRAVALAFLRTPVAGEEALTRFRREVRAMGRIGDHPNVVAIHDVGEESGRTYIVSQYVSGGSVAERLAAEPDHRLPIADALAIGGAVADALAHAHAAGIVHRDVKPGNVWLAADGNAMLGDFGVAMLRDDAKPTEGGLPVGTVPYMSPEQVSGAAVEGGSDLYSLGAMLYEMVCGRRPFEGPTRTAILHKHLHAAPDAPSRWRADVPEPLDALICRLLSKDPDRRARSASEVAQALHELRARAAAAAPGGGFVGRTGALRRLERAVDDALSGRGRFVLLSGEPGIGKTRTAEEVTRYAAVRGARVLWGRCHGGDGAAASDGSESTPAAPAYWPWAHALERYLDERDPATLARDLGAGAARIAQVLRPVRERLRELPEPAALAPDEARFEFMECFSAFLRRTAEERPLVLVLDDLHWADRSSLLLLAFFVRELRFARACVLGTFRDPLPVEHPLRRVLGDAASTEVALRLHLEGLAEDEVARMLESIGEAAPDPELTRLIHRRTDGNPFYVQEVAQLLASEDLLHGEALAALPLPSSVRDVVRRRLEQRSARCREVMEVASVLGEEFRIDVLGRVLDMPRARAIEALDEAMGADLVRAGDALGAYRFAHAQIREAVYEVLPHGRRVRLHHGIARELEALADETGDLDVAQVAHHCFAAIEIGDPEKAVDYCRRAGARAEASLAYEDAVAFRSRALHAFTLGGAGGQARRCSLLIELGEARLKADDVEAARGDLQSAVEIARELGLVDELAAAALGLAAMNQYGEVDELAISALEDALRLLPPVDSRVRACVMGLLSTRLDRRTDADRRAELSGEAVAMARRLADGEALGTALTQRIFAIRDPACLSELIEAADESAQLAMRSGTPAAALWAHVCRLICRLELGDLPAADAALTAYLKAADTSRQPYYRWYGVMLRATRRLLEGDFEEGERLAREALRLREAHDPGANEIFVAQSFMLAAERGSLAELDPAEPARLAAEYDSVPAWRAMLARVHAAAGRRAAAQAILHHDASDGFADVRRSDDWLTALALLAEVAAALGDGDRAATLLELLAPWAARSIVFDYGWAFLGSAARPAGLLAAALGRHDEAVRHLEQAYEADARTGAQGWLAHDLALLGHALSARAESGDSTRAADLLARAEALSERLGIAALPGALAAPLAPSER